MDGVNELSRKTFEKEIFGYAEYQCVSCLVASELSKSNIGIDGIICCVDSRSNTDTRKDG
jgi:hypothetical protein